MELPPGIARFGDEWAELRAYFRRHGVRDLVGELAAAAEGNKLFVYASAIAFRCLLAVFTGTAAIVALLGLAGRADIWRERVAPAIERRVTDTAFALIDGTAERILSSQRGFWLTIGAAIALWSVSAAIRGAMHALNDVYEVREEDRERSSWWRIAVSLALAVVVSACLGVAFVLMQAEELVENRESGMVEAVATNVLRWGGAVALMLFVVGLLIRLVPERDVPTPWLGAASFLVVAVWVIASLLFGVYAATVASYGAVFGGLAFLIVLMLYLYLSAAALLFGAQLDALVRTHAGPIE